MASNNPISPELLLERMPFGVIQTNLKGIITYANEAAKSLISPKQSTPLIGKHYSDLNITKVDKEGKSIAKVEHDIEKALKGVRLVSSLHLANTNGFQRWLSISSEPICDEQGAITGAISNLVEVTNKIEQERDQQEEAARYKILVENIKGVVWETIIGTETFSYISPKAEDLLGFPRKEWLKEGFWQSRIHEDDRERVLVEEEKHLNSSSSYKLEYRLIHESGKVLWVRDLVEVVKDKDNKPYGLRGISLDVTESTKSRMLLKESENRYKKLISEAPYAITIYNKEGLLIGANAKSEDYWLIDLKEYINRFNIFENELFIEESQKASIADAFNGNRGELTTEISLTHAGSARNYHIKYFPIFDIDGEIQNVIYFTDDITNLVEAKQKSKREEALKQGVLDALNEGILVVDEKGSIIVINRNLRKYVKNQPYSDLETGKSVFDFISYFDDSEYLRKGLLSILSGDTKVMDHEMKLPDGKWYNLRATPLSEPFGAVISWQNINTRKEIEIALEKSLKKYRAIYNKAPVMMHSMNHQLEIISVSDFWLEKMGYERNEVIGRKVSEFVAHDQKKNKSKSLEKLLQQGEVRNEAVQYVMKSGETIDVLLSAVQEFDDDGNFERSIAGMLDITEQKSAEGKLQDSQYKLLESQRISKIANYEFDVASGEFIPSEEMIFMMGLSEDDRHISVIERLIHPEDLDEFSDKLEQCLKEGRDFFHLYRILHLNTKKIKWISGRGKMIKNDVGQVIKMIGTVQDISEQKQAEDKIQRLTDRLLLAAEIANIGVWEFDKETKETFWGDQMYSIFSDTDRPLSLHEIERYFLDSNENLIEESINMVKKGINFLESDFRVIVEGEEKYIRAFTRVIRDVNDKVIGTIGVVYDITADKRLQKQLETSLDEKNILVKEVHHRVKNNLQLISSILALKSYDLVDDLSKSIFNDVNDRIKAMSIIHDKLYTFYNVSEIDISEYLRHIASELQVIQGSTYITIEVEATKVVLDVEKALLIGLMVSEMVSNAIKHSFKKGVKGRIIIHFEKEQDKYVLKVNNDGQRLAEDVLESSTGLGISLIKTFVKQLYGTLEVDQDENGLKAIF